MAEWRKGDPCRVVEHDPGDLGAGAPLKGGHVLPAVVTDLAGPHVFASVMYEGLPGVLGPLHFGAGDGWQSLDGTFRWRLMPPESVGEG